MLSIAGGEYTIGLVETEARFPNESPPFRQDLAGFRIDAEPTPETQVTFADAVAHCQGRDMRLPTEFEWEIASGHPDFKTLDSFEWTSWYLPYPCNQQADERFGERFRVLRGSTQRASFRTQERHYFDPQVSNRYVGFRCVSDTAPAGTGGDE